MTARTQRNGCVGAIAFVGALLVLILVLVALASASEDVQTIAFIVLGILLIAGNRVVADISLELTGSRSQTLETMYRLVASSGGLAAVIVGLLELAGR